MPVEEQHEEISPENGLSKQSKVKVDRILNEVKLAAKQQFEEDSSDYELDREGSPAQQSPANNDLDEMDDGFDDLDSEYERLRNEIGQPPQSLQQHAPLNDYQ